MACLRAARTWSALSTAPRALGTIGLAAGVAELSWKAGTGINAKFLKVGIPEATDAPQNYRWNRIVWTPALQHEYNGARWPAADGWLIWMRQTCCNYYDMERWFEEPCRFSGFEPPAPFTVLGPVQSSAQCVAATWSGYADVRVLYGWAPEHALGAPAPIQPYTNQPYTHSSPAPTPPPQTTVEQSIETELAKPENNLLRQWLNYQLGSPGERDPLGDGVNLPQPAPAPGQAGDAFAQELGELGLMNVKFEVLSNPDFDPAFDDGAVVRVSPPPGTSVEPDDEIVVTVNRTPQPPNNGECDRSASHDPGSPPSGDEFSLRDTFSGRDPDQGMGATDVPFRWGTLDWGYRHVQNEHGWDNDRDRSDTQAALYDLAPEPDDPGSHRFYFFYLGPNRIPCTRRVVARFNVRDGEPAKRGIIASFAHPGWYRRNDFP